MFKNLREKLEPMIGEKLFITLEKIFFTGKMSRFQGANFSFQGENLYFWGEKLHFSAYTNKLFREKQTQMADNEHITNLPFLFPVVAINPAKLKTVCIYRSHEHLS